MERIDGFGYVSYAQENGAEPVQRLLDPNMMRYRHGRRPYHKPESEVIGLTLVTGVLICNPGTFADIAALFHVRFEDLAYNI